MQSDGLSRDVSGQVAPKYSESTDSERTTDTTEKVHREVGAEVRFIGRVRELERTKDERHRPLSHLELEHYPDMTTTSLLEICQQAADQFSPQAIFIAHRVGSITVGEDVVLVEAHATHRKAAFQCCDFVMDFLKTRAPFWKKAVFSDGSTRWIEQRERDRQAAINWS